LFFTFNNKVIIIPKIRDVNKYTEYTATKSTTKRIIIAPIAINTSDTCGGSSLYLEYPIREPAKIAIKIIELICPRLIIILIFRTSHFFQHSILIYIIYLFLF